MFDIAWMIRLPAMGRRIEFRAEEVSTDLGRRVKDCMAEIVVVKRAKWKAEKGRKRSIFQNYIHTMFDLCDENID